MTEFATLYRESRERIAELVGGVDAAELTRVVPACPQWTVRELLAHLAGVAADSMSGNVAGAPGEAWTAAHVARRAGRSVAELLDEWSRIGPELEAALAARTMPTNALHDVLAHEADLRGALGRGRLPRSAWQASLDKLSRGFQSGGGTLEIITEDRGWLAGAGQPYTMVQVDGYELWRARFGRRSRTQMAGWRWQGEPAAHLDVLPVFGPTAADLSEPA